MNAFLPVLLMHSAMSVKYMPKEENPVYTYGSNTALHKNILRIEEIPHHVLIVYEGYYCSGSLIRSMIVVTAASCFGRSPEAKTVVKVGADTVTGPGQVITVAEIKIHEYYKHSSEVNNDIALLALKEHVTFDRRVKKVMLVDAEVALRVGTTIEAVSWGHANLPQKFLNHLVWSEMVVIDMEECQKNYGKIITSSSFCAKYQIDRRLSDNGGSATYRDLLVGILSFGGTKRDDPHIAVFTNASYFNRWITLNSRRFIEKYCVERETEIIYTKDRN